MRFIAMLLIAVFARKHDRSAAPAKADAACFRRQWRTLAHVGSNATGAVGLELVQIDAVGREVSGREETLHFPLTGSVRFEAEGDAITRFTTHSLKMHGGLRSHYQVRQIAVLGLSLEPDAADTTKFSLFDAAGRRWFHASHAHHHIDGASMELRHLGLRGADAFDQWLGISAFRQAVWAELAMYSTPRVRSALVRPTLRAPGPLLHWAALSAVR